MTYYVEELFNKHSINNDPIVRRRQINQHSIECYLSGKLNELCYEIIYCSSGYPFDDYELPCNHCFHRNDMDAYPERAFIGYKPLYRKEFDDLPNNPNTEN